MKEKRRFKSFVCFYNGDPNKSFIRVCGCTYDNVVEFFSRLVKHLNTQEYPIAFIEVFYSNGDGRGFNYLGMCTRRSFDFDIESVYSDICYVE